MSKQAKKCVPERTIDEESLGRGEEGGAVTKSQHSSHPISPLNTSLSRDPDGGVVETMGGTGRHGQPVQAQKLPSRGFEARQICKGPYTKQNF